jgi:hypothetical protein
MERERYCGSLSKGWGEIEAVRVVFCGDTKVCMFEMELQVQDF